MGIRGGGSIREEATLPAYVGQDAIGDVELLALELEGDGREAMFVAKLPVRHPSGVLHGGYDRLLFAMAIRAHDRNRRPPKDCGCQEVGGALPTAGIAAGGPD
jgi:hypothetical protein